MPSPELLIAFIFATSIFAYMPGPSTLYAAAQTIARGRRAGWFAALGIHLGGYVHVLAAAVGLAFLFEAVPTLYVGLKLAGAAYLIWLGVTMFRSKQGTNGTIEATAIKTERRAFWESVSVEVLNPKTAIFYVAFLPQFADPAASFPIWVQLLILGTIVNFMFSSADALCVILADKVAAIFKSSGGATLLAQRIGGSILVALGAKLALDK
ncbi:Homoserine/homoserine lactone efflux protein [Roseovarius sp. THAF27]|uniref:LysE family translocator n=1 Tax=Roseovarius sp. THAF27 TaxID=2587850 RepID=UPI001267F7B1|nr:LysE family translocator [Roseovarius sp. THAF27]QFT79429.1 Homoserine/homoserine lactone efflux protein [Roseovarius sp. THAF27]